MANWIKLSYAETNHIIWILNSAMWRNEIMSNEWYARFIPDLIKDVKRDRRISDRQFRQVEKLAAIGELPLEYELASSQEVAAVPSTPSASTTQSCPPWMTEEEWALERQKSRK